MPGTGDDTSGLTDPSVTVDNRSLITDTPLRALALDCVVAGIDAAHPVRLVEQRCAVDDGVLTIDPIDGLAQSYDIASYDRVLLLGGGKAAGELTRALTAQLGDAVADGIVVTTESGQIGPVELVKGSHPVPDDAARDGTDRIRRLAEDADEETLVLVVLTGGGSALLPAPIAELSLADLRATTDALLDSGMPIDDINAVRKHISAIKGGRLAATCAPATTVTIALSDVVGDDPATIASGPTVPDHTTYEDAIAAIDRHNAAVPKQVRSVLEDGTAGERAETPTEAALSTEDYHLIGTNRTAVDAAARVAADAGFEPLVLSTSIEGNGRSAGQVHAAVAREVSTSGSPVEPPAVVLSGGETTVDVRGDGRGGPNTETALAAAVEFADAGPFEGCAVCFASVDTDGVDGKSGAAGGIVDTDTVKDRTAALEALDRNDSATYLDGRAGLVRTGATGTNVNDLRVLVVDER